MADQALLDQVQEAQNVPTNQDVTDAVGNSQWANTFQNTPPVEVLRDRLNLADVINRAVTNKMAISAQSDAKALDLMQKTAQFQEYQRQAPMREALIQARTDATGATERRKAAEALSQAQDTSGLNSDIASAYQQGLKPGTPEFQQAVFSSIAAHPHADKAHVQDLHKLAGGPEDVDPVTFAQQGKAMQDAATTAGLNNVRATTVGGKWTLVKTPDVVSNEQKIADEVARVKAVDAARAEGRPAPVTPEQKVASTEALMVNRPISMAFGHLDDKGKLVPDSGDQKATHVNVSFVGPSGKIHDSGPITISEYEALKARVNGGAKPAAPVATPATAAPAANANQAAIDWLKANPNDPRAAAVKAKLGL